MASAWGGYHLRHLEQAIPRSVSGIAAGDPYARGVAWPPFSVLLGALGRLLLLAAALSLVLLTLTPWLGASARGAGLLLGFGLVALATLLVSLLEAMGRGRWALVAVACAVAAEAAVRLAGSDPFPGTGLVVAGSLAVVLVLPAVDRPARPPGAHPGHRAVDPMSGTARRQRGLILASAAAAGVIVLVTLLTTRGAERRTMCRTTLIPAYVPPHALVELVRASARPRLLVINPSNGPGAEAAPGYRAAVRTAQRAGARVLGYVHTTYGARPAADVVADIDRYTSWYGVDGIFLDEASHDVAQVGYYAALGRHVRAGARAGSSSSTPASCRPASTSTWPT